MKTTLFRANSRGYANHGWLESYHTFSFANYHNPNRVHFGVLRVLNDDRVAPGRGFDTHRHDNMEIISIPLSGDLEHKDSMGNTTVIQNGDIQVMSAGTGVSHSEYNRSKEEEVKFLQIWIFPRERQLTPRYDQISINSLHQKNKFFQIVSPHPKDDGIWIHQDVWFYKGDFENGISQEYQVHQKGQGIFIFVLEGELLVGNNTLQTRDAVGIEDATSVQITAAKPSDFMIIEVPMALPSV